MLCVSLLAVGLSGGERTGHENDPSCASPGRGDALRTVRKGIKSLGDRSRRFADKLESGVSHWFPEYAGQLLL